MPPLQIKNILDHIRAYHDRLSRRLAEFSQHESDERLTLLLKYMARHEHNFEEAMSRYEGDHEKGILNTWLNFIPEAAVDDALRDMPLQDDMTADQILASVLSFDRTLITFYRQLANQTAIPRVQELCSNLLDMEQSKDRQFSISVQGLSDQ